MTASTITITVSGITITVDRQMIEDGPESKLTHVCEKDSVNITRPADMFLSILAFYQTGQLHMPVSACPAAFLDELTYWEISPDLLSQCCKNRLQAFLDEQETLESFRESQRRLDNITPSNISFGFCTKLRSFRANIWSVTGSNHSFLLTRLYFLLSTLMVVTSIFVVAYGTDSSFLRPMTNCERLDFMKVTNMEGTDVVEETLSSHCNSSELPFKRSRSRRSLGYKSGKEIDDAESSDIGDYIFIDILVQSNSTLNRNKVLPLERVSTPLSFRNTYDEPDSPKPMPTLDPDVTTKKVKIPNMRVRMATLVVLESITIVFFTIDFILRMFSCPCLLRYFTCFINISDAVALIASYVNGIIILHNAHEQYENDWFKVLEYVQIIRALRLFRIASRVKAGRVLWYTMRANIHDLFILVLFIACGMCTFASILYLSEGREMVESIPVGWYWAVVTMTTVGYGDITPQTPVGRLIACICSVSGLLLFALTVPLFANHFIKLYSYVYTPNYKTNINASENVIEIIDDDTHRKNETI